MIADSPLVTRVQPSPSSEIWSRRGASVRAIVIHMAEGGGTANWLDNPDGNSSHYVVEYKGGIVQMVPESLAAGSMNPNKTRTTDDKPFTYEGVTYTYGRTALRRALGAGVSDPNRYVIAIETEGYAATGPNITQRRRLKALVNDIRKRHGPLPVIGHRDQQSYKACPGKKIPWADYGGHAKAVAALPDTDTGDTMPQFSYPVQQQVVMVPTGTWLYDNDALSPSANNIQISPGREMPYLGGWGSTVRIVAYVPSSGVGSQSALKTYFARASDLGAIRNVEPPPPPVDTTPYGEEDLAAARQAGVGDEQERMRNLLGL